MDGDPDGGAAGPVPDLVAQVVDHAIIGLDRDGRIRSWNAGAERLKGYPASDVIGRHFSIFYTDEDRAAGLPGDLLERARREGHVLHSGWRVRRDGTRFWGDVAITALRDGDGTVVGFAKVTRDRTEEHRLAESLRLSEERLRLLVSQVVDYAIIALDTDGVIRSWNAGAERLKGYTAHEAVGRHFSMFYSDDDRAAGLPDELLRRARADGRVEHTGWRVRQDGSRFWGDVVITALHDDAGTPTGFAKVTRDRTDQHRLEQLQASLFATLSHDIRQPLVNIGAYAALLPRADEHERALFAERIIGEAEQLERLVLTLVDFAKLRAGVVPIHLEPVAVADVVAEIVAGAGPALTGRDVEVSVDGAVASADRLALRRILANLVGNATKYSPAGSPIAITAENEDGRVRITVSDAGRGIAPEDLPTIFTAFVRGRLATEDGGTGLGLASVRQLAELQGGRVTISSEIGKGTAVSVELSGA